MKNICNYSLILGLAFALFSSCDYVTQPNIAGGNTNENCVPDTFTTNTNTQRNVLLEELTGHKCPNCPGASQDARALQQTLATSGKKLILVNLHAGTLAVPEVGTGEFESDYRCAASTAYHDYWSTPYVPLGLINRVPYNSAVLIDAADWTAAVNAEFLKPLEVNLQMQVKTDTVSGDACFHHETEFLVNKTGTFNLVIYIVEDSIVDWQINGPNGDTNYPLNSNLNNYVHRHMLRGTVTPTWGWQVSSGSVSAGQKITNSFSYAIPANWNKDHLHIIAYVYDDSNKEILQAIEVDPDL